MYIHNMILYINSESRGKANYGWLQTAYSFSFGNWYNPARMWFGALRVLNDDIIKWGHGFPDHPHDNMEIITIVTDWALQHGDSMWHGGVIKAGDVQVMSAWTWVHHSEFNASPTESAALFQLRILPHTWEITPRYDQKPFWRQESKNRWTMVVSPEGREESLAINQYAFVTVGKWDNETSYKVHTETNGAFLMCIWGIAQVGEYTLQDRDAVEITDLSTVHIVPQWEASFLVIEVPMK